MAKEKINAHSERSEESHLKKIEDSSSQATQNDNAKLPTPPQIAGSFTFNGKGWAPSDEATKKRVDQLTDADKAAHNISVK